MSNSSQPNQYPISVSKLDIEKSRNSNHNQVVGKTAVQNDKQVVINKVSRNSANKSLVVEARQLSASFMNQIDETNFESQLQPNERQDNSSEIRRESFDHKSRKVVKNKKVDKGHTDRKQKLQKQNSFQRLNDQSLGRNNSNLLYSIQDQTLQRQTQQSMKSVQNTMKKDNSGLDMQKTVKFRNNQAARVKSALYNPYQNRVRHSVDLNNVEIPVDLQKGPKVVLTNTEMEEAKKLVVQHKKKIQTFYGKGNNKSRSKMGKQAQKNLEFGKKLYKFLEMEAENMSQSAVSSQNNQTKNRNQVPLVQPNQQHVRHNSQPQVIQNPPPNQNYEIEPRPSQNVCQPPVVFYAQDRHIVNFTINTQGRSQFDMRQVARSSDQGEENMPLVNRISRRSQQHTQSAGQNNSSHPNMQIEKNQTHESLQSYLDSNLIDNQIKNISNAQKQRNDQQSSHPASDYQSGAESYDDQVIARLKKALKNISRSKTEMKTQNELQSMDDQKWVEMDKAIEQIVSNKVKKYQVPSNKLQSIALQCQRSSEGGGPTKKSQNTQMTLPQKAPGLQIDYEQEQYPVVQSNNQRSSDKYSMPQSSNTSYILRKKVNPDPMRLKLNSSIGVSSVQQDDRSMDIQSIGEQIEQPGQVNEKKPKKLNIKTKGFKKEMGNPNLNNTTKFNMSFGGEQLGSKTTPIQQRRLQKLNEVALAIELNEQQQIKSEECREADPDSSTPVHIPERSSAAIKSLEIDDDEINVDLRMNQSHPQIEMDSNTLASYVSEHEPINIVQSPLDIEKHEMFMYNQAESEIDATIKETLDDLAVESDDERYEYFSQLSLSEDDKDSVNSYNFEGTLGTQVSNGQSLQTPLIKRKKDAIKKSYIEKFIEHLGEYDEFENQSLDSARFKFESAAQLPKIENKQSRPLENSYDEKVMSEGHMHDKLDQVQICQCQSEFKLAVKEHMKGQNLMYQNKWMQKCISKIPPEFQYVYTKSYVKILDKIGKIDNNNDRRVLFRKRICPKEEQNQALQCADIDFRRCRDPNQKMKMLKYEDFLREDNRESVPRNQNQVLESHSKLDNRQGFTFFTPINFAIWETAYQMSIDEHCHQRCHSEFLGKKRAAKEQQRDQYLEIYERNQTIQDMVWAAKHSKACFVMLRLPDKLNTLQQDINLFDIQSRASRFGVYNHLDWQAIEQKIREFDVHVRRLKDSAARYFNHKVRLVLNSDFKIGFGINIKSVDNDFDSPQVVIGKENMLKLKNRYCLGRLMMNVKLYFRTAIFPQSLNVVTNEQIYDRRYQDLINKMDFMSKGLETHKEQEKLEVKTESMNLMSTFRDHPAFLFTHENQNVGLSKTLFKQTHMCIYHKLYQHDQDVLIHILVTKLYQNSKQAFLQIIEDNRHKSQYYSRELRQLRKRVQEEEDEKSSFLDLAAHTRTVFKAKQYQMFHKNIEENFKAPRSARAQVDVEASAKAGKFRRQDALNEFNAGYCEALIIEKLEEKITRVKDSISLYYKRIESQINDDDQDYNNLSRVFGYKTCMVRSIRDKKYIMEIYVPVQATKGAQKLKKFQLQNQYKGHESHKHNNKFREQPPDDPVPQKKDSKTNKILAQIIVDDFDTDEALKNISLADIKSDQSEDLAEEAERDNIRQEPAEKKPRNDHQDCQVHSKPPEPKKPGRNHLLNLLYNQGDHPLEHYKKLRKDRERARRQSLLSSNVPTPAKSSDTAPNSAARFIEDINMAQGKYCSKHNDRVIEVKNEEELKMVERFKDYLRVEECIQETQQKVSLDNYAQVREVNTRISYLQEVQADLEAKLLGRCTQEQAEMLQKNVHLVKEEIKLSIDILLKNNSYLSETDLLWMQELESHKKQTPRSMAKYEKQEAKDLHELQHQVTDIKAKIFQQGLRNLSTFSAMQRKIALLKQQSHVEEAGSETEEFMSDDEVEDSGNEEIEIGDGKLQIEDKPQKQKSIKKTANKLAADTNDKSQIRLSQRLGLQLLQGAHRNYEEKSRSTITDYENQIKELLQQMERAKRKQKFTELMKAEQEDSDLELDNEIEAMEKINVSKYKKKMEQKARLERKNKILEALNSSKYDQKKIIVASPKSLKIQSFEDKLLQRIKKKIQEANEKINVDPEEQAPDHKDLLNHPSLDNASSLHSTLSAKSGNEALRDQEKESREEAARFQKKTGCHHQDHSLNAYIRKEMSQAVASRNSGRLEDLLRRYQQAACRQGTAFRDEGGNSLVTLATLNGDTKVLQILINNGFSPDDQNHDGNTALHFAVKQNYYRCINNLINSGANESILNNKGKTPWEVVDR